MWQASLGRPRRIRSRRSTSCGRASPGEARGGGEEPSQPSRSLSFGSTSLREVTKPCETNWSVVLMKWSPWFYGTSHTHLVLKWILSPLFAASDAKLYTNHSYWVHFEALQHSEHTAPLASLLACPTGGPRPSTNLTLKIGDRVLTARSHEFFFRKGRRRLSLLPRPGRHGCRQVASGDLQGCAPGP